MKTQRKFKGLILTAAILILGVAACNQNPVSDLTAEGKSYETSGLSTVKDQGKKVLNVESFLNPGEKWKISTSDYDQYGLDAFVSIDVDAVDPRVPVYQTSGECGKIDIYIDGVDAYSSRKCGADDFKASEIVLQNQSESGLSVSAVIGGVGYSGNDDIKK